jgi:hypothetical protein
VIGGLLKKEEAIQEIKYALRYENSTAELQVCNIPEQPLKSSTTPW